MQIMVAMQGPTLPAQTISVIFMWVSRNSFFTREVKINKPNSLFIVRYQDIVQATITMNPPTRVEFLQFLLDELRNGCVID
jgi:hypothetical protein